MSSFWSSDFATEGIKDPKRKFRFTVSMTGLADAADGNEMWYAKTATKPSFQIATTEHKYLNHTFFYPGTVTWQDVTVTLVDPQDPDVAASFGSLMAAANYAVPKSKSGLDTVTKGSMVAAVKQIIIAQLDGNGAAIETWTLKNPLITEMKFGDLEYGADDLTELSLTIKYDWAECEHSTGTAFASADDPSGEV
jgi:hypothetical protein